MPVSAHIFSGFLRNRVFFHLNSSSLMMPACTRCSRVGNRFFRRKLTVLVKINSSIALCTHSNAIDLLHKVLSYIEYRAVSGVFRTIDPASVSSTAHSPGGKGGGRSIFRKTPDIGLASYSIIPLRIFLLCFWSRLRLYLLYLGIRKCLLKIMLLYWVRFNSEIYV